MDVLVNAISWRVGSELARRAPKLKLLETHPGGGQYDCLSLAGESGPVVQVNRAGPGAITVVDSSFHVPAKIWAEPMDQSQMRELVLTVLREAGLEVPQRSPSTTRRTLTYRVIAEVLSARALDGHWDVRSAFHDSSGQEGSSKIGEWLEGVHELRGVPADEVWVVLAGGLRAYLWEGWCLTANGERWDLMSRYRNGVSVPALAAAIADVPTATVPRFGMVRVPQPSCSWEEYIYFAHTFNAYRRLGTQPQLDGQLSQPVLDSFDRTGVIGSEFGVDLLRSVLFWLARGDRDGYPFDGPGGEEFVRALLGAIHTRSRGWVLWQGDTPADGTS